jgi:tripartite ATP-independent transporter DctM subunit
MTATLIIAAVLAAVVLGAPLFAVLGAGALAGAYATGLDPAVLAIEMDRLAASPNFVAIPLFVLAGVMLARGGAPQRVVAFCSAWFGWLPGGMAVVAILACAFFAAFTGASGVTILALGGMLHLALRHARYGERFSLGLLTASGSIGLLFPPSVAVILYGLVAGVSIDQLFLAGFVPGLLLLVMLSVYSMFGVAHAAARPPFVFGEAVAALRAGIWDLLLPVGVIGAIVSGVITVSEAAALTCVYALLLEAGIHRTLGLKRDLYPVLIEASVLSGGLLILLGVAMALTSLLIDLQAPMHALEWIGGAIQSPHGFLIALNLFLLVVGCLMDIFSATVVVAPLILPIAARYGVDPVHLGVVFLANLEIGYLTPPVGINLFLAMQRFERGLGTIIRAVLPFLGIMLIWLLLVTYVPALSLWWR